MVDRTSYSHVLRLATDIQTGRYANIAATVVYLYDISLTLDLEVEHIWSRLSLDLPTILYILNRYIALLFFLTVVYTFSGFYEGLSDAYCRIPIDLVATLVVYTGWTGIMTLRVCAIWRQTRLLVKVLRGLWIGLIGAILVILGITYKQVTAAMIYNTQARLCMPTTNPTIMMTIPVLPAVYELFLAILIIIKAFDFGLTRSTIPMLYRILARDAAMYFVVSIIINVIILISCFDLSPSHVFLPPSFYWAMSSITMARMVLNLRDAHYRSLTEQNETEMVGASVVFQRPSQTRLHE